tara:strand:+ start:213 stop:1187 length:975 start_codon:yes stop_codon:yes gene_type:complete
MPFIGDQATANSKIKKYSFTATASQDAFTVASNAGDELQVFLNGVLLKETDDYTYTTSTVTLGTGATVSDIVEVHVYQSFTIADAVDIGGDTMTGELEVPTVKLSSNIIKASDGGNTLTLDTSDNLTVAGNLQVGGNVIKASDGGNTITLDTSDNVTIAGAISANNLVGMIAPFATSSVPTGWLACDGSAVSRSTYSDLFSTLGATWGAGDGSSTFNVPDLEGAFLRGTGSNGTHNMADGNDFAGPSVGSFENDQFQGHWHRYNYHTGTFNNGSDTGTDAITQTVNSNVTTRVQAPIADGTNGTPRTGDETRPFNAGVKYCIKY